MSDFDKLLNDDNDGGDDDVKSEEVDVAPKTNGHDSDEESEGGDADTVVLHLERIFQRKFTLD